MDDSDNICVCLYLMVIFLVCFVSFFLFHCCFVIVFGLSLGLAIVGFVFFFPFPCTCTVLMYSYSTWKSLPSLYICAFFQISRLICPPPPPGGKNSLEEGDIVAVSYIQWGSGWENLILNLDIFRVHLFALSVMLVN